MQKKILLFSNVLEIMQAFQCLDEDYTIQYRKDENGSYWLFEYNTPSYTERIKESNTDI